MGDVFYRGIDPSGMGYAQLSYFGRWHKIISDEELKRSQGK